MSAIGSAARGRTGRLVLLVDGTTALIRPLEPVDKDAVLDLHDGASDDSLYMRFFSAGRVSAHAFVDRLFAALPTMTSLVAVRHGAVIGIATAIDIQDGEAEVALLVDESLHGLGVGTSLLEELARDARSRGVTRFTADVLTQNSAMLRVFHDLGFAVREHREHDVLALTMDITLRSEAVAAADARHRQSDARSLRPLMEPAAVAVVGVSRRRPSVGREVVENLRRGGYAGRVFAVGRPGLRIPDVECVHAIDAIPQGIDLAIVAVGGDALESTVRRLADQGTRVCVVLTSGLAETGTSGAETERRLVEIGRVHDMRIVGPNCFGVLSNVRDTRLDATFGCTRPLPGALAVGSQSGGVGIALLDAAASRRLGIASFVSMGNKADVSGNDLLSLWYDDPAIHAAALYLESFHDPRTFARLAAGFSRRKPLLVVFGGSSAAGVRGGASHTAAHATPAHALQALYKAAGAIDVEGIDDLVDTAALLTEQPPPRGARLGILSNAGGLGILAADAAQAAGLTVAEPSAGLRRLLEDAAPTASGFGNPVDLGAAAAPGTFGRVTSCLADSGELDALLVITAATAVTDIDGAVGAIEQAMTPAVDLPCLLVVVGASVAGETASRATRFASTDAAVRSLAHACRWSAWRGHSEAQPRWRTEAVEADATPSSPGTTSDSVWLGIDEAARLLAPAGIELAPYRVARSEREIRDAVRAYDPPVVVKTADPTVVHKTEGKLVRTGLTSSRQAVAAARAIRASSGDPSLPVVVQTQVSGPELAFGIVRDPTFGPLVMISSGGTSIDLWNDQVFLMPPLDREEVVTALAELRTWPLLTGFRGAERLDVDAVVDQVKGLGSLALERPDLIELDLNPVIVTADRGPVCVDAKVRALRDRTGPSAPPG